MQEPEYRFLLGGPDLEMEEIRKILMKGNLKFSVQEGIQWGARLSEYEKEFNETDQFVGIEIKTDIKPPKNYISIDHHNERAGEVSSIEQLAKLLGITLSSEQLLIAANDRGYIPEMISVGAMPEDIERIRKADRFAQGVTKEDEEAAREAIKKRIYKEDVLFVKTDRRNFTSICDFLYPYHKLLIISDKELTYFGPGAHGLKTAFNDLINEEKAYYGGQPSSGFFGLSGTWKEDEISTIADKILELVKEEKQPVHSYHIFSFPFRWDYKNSDKDINEIRLPERTSLVDFRDYFENLKLNGRRFWKENIFEVRNAETFSLSSYFYEFAADAIFYEKEEEGEHGLLCEIEMDKPDGLIPEYIIHVRKAPYPYNLKVDNITLRAYNSGVGIISYHLINDKYPHPEDVLNINQFGRRIYPSYIDSKRFIEGTRDSILAEKIILDLKTGAPIVEEFQYYEKITNQWSPVEHEFRLPVFISELLGENFITKKERTGEGDFYMRWIFDDRMFVTCIYINSPISDRLKVFRKQETDIEYAYLSDPFWDRFVFVDGDDSTIQNPGMKKELMESHTYSRWAGYGTFFGISRYSFLILTGRDPWDFNKVLTTHLKSMYFQMIQLGLAQRASLLRYSGEVAEVSGRINKKEGNHVHYIQDLNEGYLDFVNRLYFREVTAQEQGIELYDLIHHNFRIERDVKDLNREIDEIYKHENLKDDKMVARQIGKLTIVATILMIPGIFISLLGINTIKSFCGVIGSGLLISSAAIIVLSTIVFLPIRNYIKKR
jgi:hypothetical protein